MTTCLKIFSGVGGGWSGEGISASFKRLPFIASLHLHKINKNNILQASSLLVAGIVCWTISDVNHGRRAGRREEASSTQA